MPRKYKTPFTKTLFETTIDDVLPPADLSDYIALGSNIARYKFQYGNFDHIFDDYVDEHTKRMILYAEILPLSTLHKDALVRTLWIHDIPEIIDSQSNKSDMTSTDKIRHPHLALEVKQREQKIVEDIFSLEDRLLYEAFDPAKDMLFSGKIDFEKTTPIGLLARVLDNFVDGTNSFHGFVTDYLMGDEFRESLALPQRDSFEYCFQKGIDVYKHISDFDHPEYRDVRKIILHILKNDFFDFIDQIWTPLAVGRLPEYAREEYERFRKQVPHILEKK